MFLSLRQYNRPGTQGNRNRFRHGDRRPYLLPPLPHSGLKGGRLGLNGHVLVTAQHLATLPVLVRGHGAEEGLVGCHLVLLGRHLWLQLHLRMPLFPLQRLLYRIVYRIKELSFTGKFYFRFRRMDIHVHGVELALHPQDAAGELAHHFLILIRLFQRGGHGA